MAVEWQPIETAPKDGSWIVLGRHSWTVLPVARWGEVFDGEWAFDAWLLADPTLCLGVDDGVLGWADDHESDAMPTHWMPVLSLPEEAR